MAQPSQAAKDAAFRNQERATQVVIATGPAAAGAAIIPAAGPFIGLALAMVGAGFGIRAMRESRIAHDPPRTDYESSTTLPPPRFDPTVLGGNSVEVAASELVRRTDETARALEAMIVAIERASGAELAGDLAMTDARIVEAYEFAHLAIEGLRGSAEAAGPFRAALDDLSPEVRDRLQAAGVPPEYALRITDYPTGDVILDLSTTVGQAAESDYEFANSLADLAANQTLVQPGTT